MTVDKFLFKSGIKGDRGELRRDQLIYLCTEFAKLHCKEQAIAINKKITEIYQDNPSPETFTPMINAAMLRDAYPLNQIK